MLRHHYPIYSVRAFSDETSSLPDYSVRGLFWQIEIWSGIYTVYFNCKYFTSLYFIYARAMRMPPQDYASRHFPAGAKIEISQWKKPRLCINVIKDFNRIGLFVKTKKPLRTQISDLCGSPLLSYLPKRSTEIYRAQYENAMLVSLGEAQTWRQRWISDFKHLEFTSALQAIIFVS